MRQDLTGYLSGQTGTIVRSKYLSALVLIAVLALGEYIVTDRLIEAQEHHASFLERSARQRMHFQRIALLSQQLISARDGERSGQFRLSLKENLREMQATHSAIVNNEDLARVIRRKREGNALESLRLERQLALYAAAVDSLLAAPADRLEPGNPHFQRVLLATSGETAALLEEVMGHLVRATEDDLRHFRTIARALFAGKLVSLVLLGLLLFEPMVVRILYNRDMLLKANQGLARVSATDGLTQAANRRAFEERLDEEWRRAFRDAVPLTLLMIDIDHFKAYNDRYGHQAGDECLKLITRDFRTRLRRPADFLARYGGEEFSIILPDTDLSGALVVAEDLRRRTTALEIAHGASPVAGVVTLSIGVAEAEPAANGGGPTDLVAASDRALYQAKRLGRNRVTTTKLGADEDAEDSGRDFGQLENQQTAQPAGRDRR
jgi:diguanylate cyclase (GGDEF)-like protein